MKHPNEKTTQFKSVLVLIITLLFSCHSFAQQNNPLINSGEIMKKGADYQNDDNAVEAIKQYLLIPRSDTNYAAALLELSNSYYEDSQYNASYKCALEGIKMFPDRFKDFAMQAGNALDDMKRTDEAMSYFDKAIAKAPQSPILYFNKAISLMKAEKTDEAIKSLQQCLLLDPYYQSAHYFLGVLYLKRGQLVPSMLALQTYLMVAPGGRYNQTAVNVLSAIAKVTDDVLDSAKKKRPSKEDNFDDLQQLVISKVALDEHYALKAKLEDPIVRQLQVVDEKLDYNANDKGFCMQYYVPLYSKLFAENDFEPMIFTLFSGLGLKEVDNWNKHNKKKFDDFAVKASDYLNTIKYTRVLSPDQRQTADQIYFYVDGNFLGKGKHTKDAKGNIQLVGVWDFYYDNGVVKAHGGFDDNYKKTGEWDYYYENGQLKEKSMYKDDLLQGASQGWYDNGNEWYHDTYAADKKEGEETMYHYNGNLKTITEYKNDMKNGLEKTYDDNGDLSYSINYTNDKEDGMAKSIFYNGAVEKQVNYKDGKAEGTYTQYTLDGKLLMKGEYVNDLREGLWISYYANGTVKDKTTYTGGEITGEFTEYYPNGVLSRKGNYTKKKIDGKMQDYDDDGKLYSDATYEKGKLREINFYDKTGTAISTTTTRRGAADITFYNADGNRVTEGYFNKTGDEDGSSTMYYESGKVSDNEFYKKGNKDGASISYYPNGQKKYEDSYTDGTEDGYVKSYYANGKLSYEGWVVSGSKQQRFLYYNTVGDTVRTENYLDDNLNGYVDYKYPNKAPDCEYKYGSGWIEEITQFDSTGKVLVDNVFKQGNGPLLYKYYDGKKYAEGTYAHYMLNGPYKVYFPNGTLMKTSFYKNNDLDSTYKMYYYGGKLKTSGVFRRGEKTGTWDYYYDNGQLSEEENYTDGVLDGVDKMYDLDGVLDKVITWNNGNKDGEYKMYGSDNQLAAELIFKNGKVISYTYEGKDGQLVKPILLKGQTGLVKGYYKNGTESMEMTLLDGDVEGPRKIFYTTGQLYVEGSRIWGYDNGVRKMYYPNGTLWQETNYVMGDLHGVHKVYYPGGKLKEEENYYADELNGVAKYYDEQGNLKQTRVYYYGLLMSVK